LKIGFSFGRCLRDIVNGVVKFDDILYIIARTHMVSDQGVKSVIASYMHQQGYLVGLNHAECERIGLDLWQSGKVIEPRATGTYATKAPDDYIWMDLYPTEANITNDGVKAAWEAYRIMLALTTQLPDSDPQVADLGSSRISNWSAL
jgi:hypothetical protein